jgi:hypothetical protein
MKKLKWLIIGLALALALGIIAAKILWGVVLPDLVQ